MKKLVDKCAVANRIGMLTAAKLMTNVQAAAACDLAIPTFETYRYGGNLPGAEGLAKLAVGLRTSADWLLFGEDH